MPNLLDDDADVLVCTTNAVGVMGKGIALDFARRWPMIKAAYAEDCRAGRLRGGSVAFYDLPGDLLLETKRQWAAFCTKQHWRDPSRYEWVEAGLREMVKLMREEGHRSCAIPPLGCGFGGLDWKRVRPMIEGAMAGASWETRIYNPDLTLSVLPAVQKAEAPKSMPTFHLYRPPVPAIRSPEQEPPRGPGVR